MGKLDGKVAFVTGAARGQGRSHAVTLAAEGADIIAVDICRPLTDGYPGATVEDLAETVRLVEDQDRRIIASQADVRDLEALTAAVDHGVSELGRLDVVVANAGIWTMADMVEMTEEDWDLEIDINLTGVWKTVKAALPHVRAGGRGGSIIMTSSIFGLSGAPNNAHYVAAKHGVVGLMRALAHEGAPDGIRVNSINPTNVNTHMIRNELIDELFAPDLSPEERTEEALTPRFEAAHLLKVPWVEVQDISNVVLWLASDDSRYVTGVALPVDAGRLINAM